jgi:3-polyprenyl-4-hydroxybenzoate decarboxylase
MFNLRITLRQRVPGEARNAIAAAFASLGNVKNVFVFDPDIDIFSEEQVDWALATRFQADRDLVVVPGMRALPLDPSLQNHARIGGKAGFDCTVPFGQGDSLAFSVPAPPAFEAERQATVEAALDEGPKFFMELMAATRSRDGREIVRELERLAMLRKVERDREGRWLFGRS